MAKLVRAERPNLPEPDRRVLDLTAEGLDAEVNEYVALLDGAAPEADIQAFIAAHSYFFNGDLRLFGPSPLYSKPRLGDQYELDFAWVDGGSFGAEWQFVELEPPRFTLFTKSGQPSEPLVHAIHQVRTWHSWIHDNLAYARELMPHVDYPMATIFIGRRQSLSDSDRKALKRLNFENRDTFCIHTLDHIAATAHSVAGLLRDDGRWWIPADAYSHADLRSRTPRFTFFWLQDPAVAERTDVFRPERIQERRGKSRDIDE